MDIRLAERSFGENEGKLYSEVYLDDDTKTNYEERFRRKHPLEESHEEVFYRVKSFMESMICSLSGNETVICVTSGSVIRIILKIKNNLSLEEMYNLEIPNLFFVKL